MKKLKFSIGGQTYDVEIEDPSASVLVVLVNGKGYTVVREELSADRPADAPREEAVAAPIAASPLAAEHSSKDTAPAPGTDAVRAPIPGKILALAVEVGDRVRYSDALCTLEAMKMESVIRAPVNGTVEEIRVKPGDNVQYDDVLVVLRKVAD
jgi:biotin carboxyl carrier protein